MAERQGLHFRTPTKTPAIPHKIKPINTGLPSPVDSPVTAPSAGGAKSRRATLLAMPDMEMSDMDVDTAADRLHPPPPSLPAPAPAPPPPPDGADSAGAPAAPTAGAATPRLTISGNRLHDNMSYFDLMGEHDVALCALLLQQQELKDLRRKRDRVKRELNRFGTFFAEDGGQEDAQSSLSALDARISRLEGTTDNIRAIPWEVNRRVGLMFDAHTLSRPGGNSNSAQPSTHNTSTPVTPNELDALRSEVRDLRNQWQRQSDTSRNDNSRSLPMRRDSALVNDLKSAEDRVSKLDEDTTRLDLTVQKLRSSTRDELDGLKSEISRISQLLKSYGGEGNAASQLSRAQIRSPAEKVSTLSPKDLEIGLANLKRGLMLYIDSANKTISSENAKLAKKDREQIEEHLSDIRDKFTSTTDRIAKEVQAARNSQSKTNSWAPGLGNNQIPPATAASDGTGTDLQMLSNRLRHYDIVLDGLRQRIDNSTSETQVRRLAEVLVAQVPSLSQLMTIREEFEGLAQTSQKDSAQVALTSRRIEDLEEDLKTSKLELASMVTKTTSDDHETMKEVKQQVAELAATTSSLQENIEVLRTKHENGDSARKATSHKVQEIEEVVETLHQDVQQLGARTDEWSKITVELQVAVNKQSSEKASNASNGLSNRPPTSTPSSYSNGHNGLPKRPSPSAQGPTTNGNNGKDARPEQNDDAMQDTIFASRKANEMLNRPRTASDLGDSFMKKRPKNAPTPSKRRRVDRSEEEGEIF